MDSDKKEMTDLMLERFNTVTKPSFNESDGKFEQNIADHWETFQEGWVEGAAAACKILLEMHDKAKGNHNFYLHAAVEIKRKMPE